MDRVDERPSPHAALEHGRARSQQAVAGRNAAPLQQQPDLLVPLVPREHVVPPDVVQRRVRRGFPPDAVVYSRPLLRAPTLLIRSSEFSRELVIAIVVGPDEEEAEREPRGGEHQRDAADAEGPAPPRD